jgi:hypothetical protein
MFVNEIKTSNISKYGTMDYYKILHEKDIPYMIELTKEVFRMLQLMFNIKFNKNLKLKIDTKNVNVQAKEPKTFEDILDVLLGNGYSAILGQYDLTNNTITIFLLMHQYKTVNHLIYTICHEIAHIKEMNHEQSHTKLTWQLKNLVKTGLISNNYVKCRYKEKKIDFSEIFRTDI